MIIKASNMSVSVNPEGFEGIHSEVSIYVKGVTENKIPFVLNIESKL